MDKEQLRAKAIEYVEAWRMPSKRITLSNQLATMVGHPECVVIAFKNYATGEVVVINTSMDNEQLARFKI